MRYITALILCGVLGAQSIYAQNTMVNTPDSEVAGKAVMLTATPYLPVADVEVAAKFYTEVLGFMIAHQEGSAFMLVKSGEVEIGLARTKDEFTPAACMVKVRNIDELYKRCQEAGATIKSPLERKPWGMRMFLVADKDGNLLDFAEHDAG